MAADDILAGLSQRGERIAGTDAERRAAVWLADHLRGESRRLGRVRIETFWCRPNWALAAAWHAALALAASLVSVSAPKVGGAMLIVAIVSVILDAHIGRSPGRLLTPYRATQNVVVAAPGPRPPLTLLITANLDVPRAGAIRRRPLRGVATWLRSLAGPATPGWAGWLTLTMALVLATAVARAEGSTGGAIGILQLIPTVGLVLALALLLDQASAAPAPAPATEDGAVATAIALARALAVAPPARTRVELLIQGGGDGGGVGLRRHLRAHRLTAPTAVILSLDTARPDRLGWWVSDGPLIPLRAMAVIRRQAAAASTSSGHRGRPPAVIHGRGAGPALPGLVRHIPTLEIGAPLGELDALMAFALALVDTIDAAIVEREAGR